MSSPLILVGRLVGPYSVVRKLGEGGMGAVYEAVHKTTGRHAAIKFLHEEYQEDQELLSRFFNEAIASSTLDHPGMVQIFDNGMLDGKTPYLIMEYLRGPSLEQRLAALDGRPGLPLCEALNVAWQTASVLAELEGCGIVHRDLKPGNLMLVPDAVAVQGVRVKILDLGLAKLNRELFASAVHTRCGMVMGTPLYMSPEQCNDTSDVDGKTDVYSLGAVLFEMLTGQPPFITAGCHSMLALHMFAPVPRLKNVVPGVPEALDELVTAMLGKRATERPAMAAVRDRLAKLLAEPLDGAAPGRRPPATPQGDDATRLAPAGQLASPAQRAHRRSAAPRVTALDLLAKTVAQGQNRTAATRVLVPADTLVRDTHKDRRLLRFHARSQRDLTTDFVRISLASLSPRPNIKRSPVPLGCLMILVAILLCTGGQTYDPSPRRTVSQTAPAPAGIGSARTRPAS